MRPMALDCGHQFCAGAWMEYLQQKVKDKTVNCVFTNCQQTNCNMLVPHQWFLDLLVDKEEFPYHTKYIQWHRRQFTDSNRNVKSCPRVGCEKYIELTELFNGEYAECSCGELFCVKCSQEKHDPADCKQVQMWLDREKDGNMNDLWIKANTKKCP